MMWSPRVGVEGAQESGVDYQRKWVEPLYMVPLYLLAIAGLFVVPPAVRTLALIFAGYETLASWSSPARPAIAFPGTSCWPCSRPLRSTGWPRGSAAQPLGNGVIRRPSDRVLPLRKIRKS